MVRHGLLFYVYLLSRLRRKPKKKVRWVQLSSSSLSILPVLIYSSILAQMEGPKPLRCS